MIGSCLLKLHSSHPRYDAALMNGAAVPSDAAQNSLDTDWHTFMDCDSGIPDGGQSRGS
jgi:hypothetical protein